MVLLIAIRVLLARRNRMRSLESRDTTYDDVYVIKTDEDGKEIEVKIAKVSLLLHSQHGSLLTDLFSKGIPRLDRLTKPRLPLCPLRDEIMTVSH
jgi:hypothetical protein